MFHKIMFSHSAHGTTARLVIDGAKTDVRNVEAVSRLFPMSEFRKMGKYHVSPAFPSFADAFAYVFPCDVLGNPKDIRISAEV